MVINNVNQIEEILDKYLQDYLDGQCTHANVMFIGHEGYGRSSVISRWIKKHETELNPLLNIYPSVLRVTENGILVDNFKDGKRQYVIPDDELELLQRENSVLFLQKINWGRDNQGDEILYDMIKNRHVKTAFEKEYDLRNLCMVIATAFPDDGLNKTFSLPNDLIDYFDIYEVQPVFQDTADFIYNQYYEMYLNFPSGKGPYILDALDKIRKWPKIIKHTPFFPPSVLIRSLEWAHDEESFIKEIEGQVREDKETVSQIKEIFEK